MEELPPVAGDALDLTLLEAWTVAQEKALKEVKWNLLHCQLGEDFKADDVPRDQALSQTGPSTSMIAAARLSRMLGGSCAVELVERWKEIDQALKDGASSTVHAEVKSFSEDLTRARAERIEAHHRLQEWKERKRAAQSALAKAMEVEDESEDDLDDNRSVAPSEMASECGDEKAREKKRWGGAKKFLGKGFKKLRGKTSQTGGSLTPPAVSSPGGSVSVRTPSPSRPPTPKQLMVQASSDELVLAAEGIQSAAEDFDKETSKCQALQEAIAECMSKHRAGPVQQTQEALRDGVCALEEWADEVKTAMASLGELKSEGPTSVGEASDHSEDSDFEVGPELQIQAQVDPLGCLEQMEMETKVLLRRLPSHFVVRHLELEEGPSDSQEDLEFDEMISEWNRLQQQNEDLQRSASQMGAIAAAQQLRRFTHALEGNAHWLEGLAMMAHDAQLQYGATSSSESESGEALVEAFESPTSQSPATPGVATLGTSQSPKASSRPTTPRQGGVGLLPLSTNLEVPDGSSAALSPSFGSGLGPFQDRLRDVADVSPGGTVPSAPVAPGNPFEDALNPFSDSSDPDAEVVKKLSSNVGVVAPRPAVPKFSPETFNPFSSGSGKMSEPGENPFMDAESEMAGDASPSDQAEEVPVNVTESPASLTEVQEARPALLKKPTFVDAISKMPESNELTSQSSTPRVTSITPGAASSMQMWKPPSPRQLPSGLAGCLCSVSSSSAKVELDEDMKQIQDSPSPEAALAASDAALAKGRLGNGDYSNWNWRDHAAEEAHQLLRYSSHSLSDILTDEDWGYFSYELLLLCRHLLREGPALDQVLALIPICRVRLGINSQLHHHMVELSRPGSEALSPLDVRYRAALLLRLWSNWETFEYGTVADPSKDWTAQWICMQLRILRGSVIERAMDLDESDDAFSACRRCFQVLRQLHEIAVSGDWGKAQALERLGEASGRRLLTILCRELDALKPAECWSFNVVFAARIFATLWRAAADSEAEDCLSLDAPNVAAALLSGLHPHMAPLRLETHALLLAQQVWSAATSKSQMPAKALLMSESILNDFSRWLQKTPVDAASCFARQGISSTHNPPLELVARRLLTVDLRDQLIQTLRDYRRHFEPEAFRPVLQLWVRCYREMRCSEVVGRDRSHQDGMVSPDEDSTMFSEKGSFLRDEESEELLGRFGQWFVWESNSKAAELALHPFDEPPVVPPGDEAWKRLGPKIKSYLQGLTGAVQSLLEELECEKSVYNEAWAGNGLGFKHLAVASAAMVAAVRPRVDRLKLGVWPTESGILEVPPGGGRLIQVLEALDREASRYRESKTTVAVPEPLVDILVPHVTAALTHSLQTLDRDITSHALMGNPDAIFVPLQPPTTIFCEAVVTLWRFIHDALDAPLSLGIPVDIVVNPFMRFLSEVLPRSSERLLRSCEQREAFGMSLRAAQLAAQLKLTGCAIDSDEDDGAGVGSKPDESKRSGRSRRKFFTKSEKSFLEDASKNVIIEVKLLEVNPQVVVTSVQQVMVRLSSFGFCCGELAEVQAKLFKMINSGDDDGCPTARHNEARMAICEELPDLQESLLCHGQTLARYLAARLVYYELRSELFEKLYFKTPLVFGAGTPTPASGSITPGATMTTSSFLQETQPTLTLKDVVLSRQNSFLSLIEQTPNILLVSFVGELGIELTHAWLYVIIDYLRRQKLDQICEYLESDQEALSRSIESMMQLTRKRIQTTALGGLTHEDCRNVEKRLEEVQRLSQCLIEEIQSRTAEELARYAAKIRGEHPQGDGARERSQTPPPGVKPPRSASPAPSQSQSFVRGETSLSPRGASPQLDSPKDSQGTSKRRAKDLFQRAQRAWKATKVLGKHKDGQKDERMA